MARPYTAFISFVILLVLCHCVTAKSRRFGAVAETLHKPSLSEAEKWGEKFVVMHANDYAKKVGDIQQADDVDKFLRRFRRDTSSSGSIASSKALLNDSHNMLVVHWAGESSSVIIALAKSSSLIGTQVDSSRVFLSSDYGKKFSDITSRVTGPNVTAAIDKYYNSDILNSHYVFTDVTHKCVFTTRDYGLNFVRRCELPFRPSTVSLNPSNAEHILALDQDASNSPLYISEDFGWTWRLMRENVKSFFWGVQSFDRENTLYIEEKRSTGGNAVLRSHRFFAGDDHEHVIVGVEDFEVQEEYMFATKRQHLYGSHDANGTLQFWVSYKREEFVNAQFPVQHGHTDFYVADASEGQVMLCVVHNESDTHLYISDVEGSRFSLSLENIVYFNPQGAHKDTWLSYYNSETFADIHKVEGLRGIYIASQLIDSKGSFTVENQRSLITYDKGGKWELLNAPVELQGTYNRNCTKRQNCSLHLSQKFTHLYPGSQTQPIMSRSSAPGLILASGTVGRSLKSQQDLFVSRDAGFTWYQVMTGIFKFSMADHGGVILASEQFQPTDSVYYSLNEGESWHEYKFEDQSAVRVYGILTEPGEKTTVFSIFGSPVDHHSWILFQLNVSQLLGSPCTKNDYKNWSLSEANPDAGCLLGKNVVYRRRIAHTVCYNGEDFVRHKDLRNCSCTRDDFECDFGFKQSENVSSECVRDELVDDSLINRIPQLCPPGTFYSYTVGYRRVSGDTCIGGQEYKYAPKAFYCPVRERQEFVLVAGGDRIQALDIDHFQSTDLYTVPIGQRTRINAVIFNYAKNQLFWSTSEPARIQSVSLDSTSNRSVTTLAEGRMQQVTSLAFDWTADTLYWTDESEGAIELMKSNGFFRKRLIYPASRPTQIVLDPVQGWMYWLEMFGGENHVMRAWMNGAHISILKQSSQNIQGLTLDIAHGHLFFTSSYISGMELDGSNASILQLPHQNIQSPGLVAVFKENLFWINRMNQQLTTTSIHNDGTALVVHTFNFPVVDMKIISHISQSAFGVCNGHSAPCLQLCTSFPGADSKQNRSCLCGDEFNYDQHASGDQHCHCDGGNQAIINGHCQLINTTGASCGSHEFKCRSNERCIPKIWQCDHDDDCGDMSDETDCPFYVCPTATHFTCPTGKCIPKQWHCDFDNDCGHNEDEEGCVYSSCTAEQFTCQNKKCINKSFVCDWDDDCRDGSDERNCTFEACHSWEFTCGNRECVAASARCNGDSDCSDGSDERNCSTTCSSFMFTCRNGRCIYPSWLCDYDNDCRDGSDEINCTISTTTVAVNRTCNLDEYRCASGFCISLSTICDRSNDCGDWSDEAFCDYPSHANTTSHPSTCQQNEFTCNSGQCIPLYQRCNNNTGDCWDNSDEFDCNDHACPANHFKCYESNNTECIWSSWKCDGEKDCRNGEDERLCDGAETCTGNFFKCIMSGECIPNNKQCDGKYDCGDHSDEGNCKVSCQDYGSNMTACCQNNCLFLECHADRVIGCFDNNTSIGSSCSGNNNICKKQNSSTSDFLCFGTDKWIPWIYVCNMVDNCGNNADEISCEQSRMSKLVLQVGTVTNTSIMLYWWSSNTEFIVSYLEPHGVRKNQTVKDKWFTLENLKPWSTYVFAVYEKNGTEVRYPCTSKEVATLEGQPTPPRNLQVNFTKDVDSGFANISWQPPAEPNGPNLLYKVKVTDLNTTLSFTRNTADVHTMISNLIISHRYNLTVQALSRQGFFSETISRLFFYNPEQIQLKCEHISDTSVDLVWTNPVGAQSSLITATIPYQGDRQITRNTTNCNFTFTGLCPSMTVGFTVEAVYGPSDIGPPSQPLLITTTGRPLPTVRDVKVEIIQARSVLVSFIKPSEIQTEQCTVYYVGNSEPDMETFFKEALRQRTTDTRLQITHLHACETYFFRVGCGLDTCPISSAVVIHTQEDDTGPPTHLRYEFIFGESGHIEVELHWKAPCPQLTNSLKYILETISPEHPQGQSDTLPFQSKNASLSYIWKELTRGETYHFRIRTAEVNAEFSETLSVSVPPYPKPENFNLLEQSNLSVIMYWTEPADKPPADIFQGYNVTILKEGKMVETKIVTKTLLSQNVSEGVHYTILISMAVSNGPNGEQLAYEFTYFTTKDTAADNIVSNKNLVAILVPVFLVVVVLIVVVVALVIRHQRLQRSFLAFANSHYNTHSGVTTFSGDLDDDEPMIQGFSDDEPLVLA